VNIEDTGISAEELQKLLLEEAGVAGIAGQRLARAAKLFALLARERAKSAGRSAGAHAARLRALARGGFALVSTPPIFWVKHHASGNSSVVAKQTSGREASGKMKHLFHFGAACSSDSPAQQRHKRRRGRCPVRISKKRTTDCWSRSTASHLRHHSHATFPDDSDMDAMASPPGESTCCASRYESRIRGRGEGALRIPLDDFKPEHAKWLIDKKKAVEAAGGTAYWNSILDKMNIETCLRIEWL